MASVARSACRCCLIFVSPIVTLSIHQAKAKDVALQVSMKCQEVAGVLANATSPAPVVDALKQLRSMLNILEVFSPKVRAMCICHKLCLRFWFLFLFLLIIVFLSLCFILQDRIDIIDFLVGMFTFIENQTHAVIPNVIKFLHHDLGVDSEQQAEINSLAAECLALIAPGPRIPGTKSDHRFHPVRMLSRVLSNDFIFVAIAHLYSSLLFPSLISVPRRVTGSQDVSRTHLTQSRQRLEQWRRAQEAVPPAARFRS